MLATRRRFGDRRSLRLAIGLCLAAYGFANASCTAAAAEVSFTRDVMQVLSKAGCNLGTCHGNANGKAGFKLSLRGQDPQLDHTALVRDQLGRRIDKLEPEQSLLLLKATMQQAHEGGRRFTRDSHAYAVLKSWIAAGAPSDVGRIPALDRLLVTPVEQFVVEPAEEVRIRAEAVFADGSRLDVSDKAVYETSNKRAEVAADGTVRRSAFGETTVLVRYLDRQSPVRLAFVPHRPDFHWPDAHEPNYPAERNYIDTAVFAKLRALRMLPAPLCDDVVFLRRVYLDLLGLLPTKDEAQRFLAEVEPDKRTKLIDELLARPEFADHWALKFADLLRLEEEALDRKGVQGFHAWLRRRIDQDLPLNEMASELIASRGSTYLSPAANYYRAQRDPVVRAETAAQVFLGVRLQCAKCHNHPFDRWTQTDYYRWVNVFSQVKYKILEDRLNDKNATHEFDGEQLVWLAPSADYDDPRTGAPRAPRMLGAVQDLPTGEDRLRNLSAWLAADDNPFFAQAQANRIWFHLMGRGIVDPIDDFRATNPPSHPELLARLAADFVEHRFRLKHLIRTIMNSRTYQLSGATDETNRDDESNYAHVAPRPLAAEPLLDALSQVTGTKLKFAGYPLGMRAGQLPGVRTFRERSKAGTGGDTFLTKFGKPLRLLSCECERSSDVALGHAFQLISGPTINELLTTPENRIDALLKSGRGVDAMIEELAWASLSRAPTAEERTSLAAYVAKASDKRSALEDVVWGFVNAKEFLLRR
ncbi:MAG: DUF1549 and DUF1553 domain-containing protein [Planctomycetia bacterium]|nr:DUF1549 and DUF1553 domain-containing protein [Planctomycetia bacterium]